MKEIDNEMIINTLQVKGAIKKYCVPFWQMIGAEEEDPDCQGYFIHVINGLRTGSGEARKRSYMVGCTKSEGDDDDDVAVPNIISSDNKHPLSGGRVRKFVLSKDEFWEGMKNDLAEFLRGRKEKAEEKQKDKKQKKDKEKAKLKEGEEKKEEELAKRNRPDTAKSMDTARSGESSASSTTWRGKRRKKEASQEHEQMRDQIKKKKGELEALVRDLRDKLEDEEMNDLPQVDEEIRRQPSKQQNLNYILNGRAGQIIAEDLSVITILDLEDGLLELNKDQEGNKAESTREKTNLHKESYGATSVWVPSAVTLVSKGYLNILKKRSTIVKKLEDLFSFEQSSFSREALRIMTMFGLHNMGGSDEGSCQLCAARPFYNRPNNIT